MPKIKIDIEKAKEIRKESLREAREPILKQLDLEFMQALERGEDTSAIVKKKQELRDITKHKDLVNAKTPEQLLAFNPEILNK